MLDLLLLRQRRRSRCWQQSRDQPAVPRARRVPHLRRRPGHRRRDAAAPARADAQELLARPDSRGHRRGHRPARRRDPGRHVARPSATRATRTRCSASPRPCSASRSPPTRRHRDPAVDTTVGRDGSRAGGAPLGWPTRALDDSLVAQVVALHAEREDAIAARILAARSLITLFEERFGTSTVGRLDEDLPRVGAHRIRSSRRSPSAQRRALDVDAARRRAASRRPRRRRDLRGARGARRIPRHACSPR